MRMPMLVRAHCQNCIKSKKIRSLCRHIIPKWQERQLDLEKFLKQVEVDANQSSRGAAAGDPKLIDWQYTKVDEIEQQTQFWELPTIVAETSYYQREKLPEITVEGWFYKMSSAMISLQPWQRRWFVMDHQCIYYYHDDSDKKASSSGHGNKGLLAWEAACAWVDDVVGQGYAHSAHHVKVCDVVLTTVRELAPADSSDR